MQAGDIFLFRAEKAFFSKVIAWGTNSKYSHVAICISPEMNLAIEAMTKGGVRARDIRSITEAYDIYRIKDKSLLYLNKTASFLVSKLNSNYDYFGVVFLGTLKLLSKILGKTLKNIANKWQKDRDYFCSELCCEAFYNGSHIDIVPHIEEWDIASPGDIAKSSVVEMVVA
ncbi:MAG: YiiX/YebB-like N1pC/P60 family cysteine hydrolase [Candidatus Omnitrophota bacterium]